MTVAEWLEDRDPKPPDALDARMRASIGTDLTRDAADLIPVCVAAAERTLSALLVTTMTEREHAFELLAADALVTYAFEAAAEDPDTLSEVAVTALSRLSALAPLVGGAS
ncbi:MAG: hypothetical protein M3081_03765 [Gemmatimonadota bacterium]|nr:hypothetical protein [Gemmatimonadota bacterium]